MVARRARIGQQTKLTRRGAMAGGLAKTNGYTGVVDGAIRMLQLCPGTPIWGRKA